MTVFFLDASGPILDKTQSFQHDLRKRRWSSLQIATAVWNSYFLREADAATAAEERVMMMRHQTVIDYLKFECETVFVAELEPLTLEERAERLKKIAETATKTPYSYDDTDFESN